MAGDCMGMDEVLTTTKSVRELEEGATALHYQFPYIPVEQIIVWFSMCDDLFITRLACMSVGTDGDLYYAHSVVVRGMS